MATRLYPRTENPAILEKLAGVPAGTADKVKIIVTPFEERRKARDVAWASADAEKRLALWHENNDDVWQKLERLNDDPDCAAYDSFLTFGWGRLTPGTAQGYSGCETDPAKIEAILQENQLVLPVGVSIADLQGLHWS